MTKEEYFCREFMDKIYYFCLKKTGSTAEAEDLSGEISVEVLAALKKGNLPEHFHAYVWQIVRNRYARWAKQKHRCMKHENFSEEDACMQIDDSVNLEEQILKQEQIQILRQELTLISRGYREILIAYYVENRKISDIAENLSIPEGTVKTKLFHGRQKLKEGMAMARTFGKLSYAPEEIDFCQSGGKSTMNEPDIYLYEDMYSKICKNILIEAYCNPVTMQELSIELGIALPYLEGFVEEMTKSTLLTKTGNKAETAVYETNFVIISSEARRKMNDKLAQIQGKFVEIAKQYLETSRELQLAEGNEILGHYQNYEEQKWTLALQLADDIQWAVYDKRNLQFFYDTVRPNGGSWDIMGIQKYQGPSFLWVGHSYIRSKNGDELTMFYTDYHLEKYGKGYYLTSQNTDILYHILRGQYEGISERELKALEEKNLVHKTEDGQYKVTFGVYQKKHNSKHLRYGISVDIYNHKLLPVWNQLMDLAEEYVAYCEEIMRSEVPKQLMSQFNFCMHSIPFLRGAVVEGLIREGFLKPEEELSEMVGVFGVL